VSLNDRRILAVIATCGNEADRVRLSQGARVPYAVDASAAASSPALMCPEGQVIVSSLSRSSSHLTFTSVIAITFRFSSYSTPWPSGVASASAGRPS
jgi:hypothetical protein